MYNSVLAVLAGYGIFSACTFLLYEISGVDPHMGAEVDFVVGSILFGIVLALIAGYVTSMIAKRREIEHGIALALVIAVTGLVSVFVTPGENWSEVATVFIIAPTVMIGAKIRAKMVYG